jgi:hypothetical protein
MASDYSDVPTVATGDWIDAAFINQYWGDNFRALWKYTAAGDITYALDADTLAKVAKPSTYPGLFKMTAAGAPSWLVASAAYQVMRSNGSLEPEWASQGHMTRAVRNTDYSFTRGNYITWDLSTTLDDDNQHDPGSNPTRITIAETGIYLAVLELKMSIGSGDWAMDCQVRINGTAIAGNSGWGGNGGGATRYFGCTGEVNVTAGQYIEGFLDWNGTGTTCTIYASSKLFVLRLR